MPLYGYARVSTTDQDLTLQIDALKAAGCDIVRAEKASGTSTAGRDELAVLLEFIRENDTLIVTRIDRLARSIADLQDIVRRLKAKGARLKATEQPFDTGSIYGELTLNLLGVFAQFETQLRRERQLEGIAKAKAEGIYKGRKCSIDRVALRQMLMPEADGGAGLGASEVARRLGIARGSVYRLMKEIQP
jgi:DNA invertase Pin-like site-specific DNA recombinase